MRLKQIAGRALQTTALLALLIIAGIGLNLVLMGYAVFRMADTEPSPEIGTVALALETQGDEPELSEELKAALDEKDCWLLLLDEDGNEVLSYAKPAGIGRHFSPADIAGFTRWYLEDYPVRVRTMGDGLLVLAYPKNTVWKYSFETELPSLVFWPIWAGAVLLCNFLLILIISTAWTARAYKKRDEARTEWIAAVSHDVRTPLAAVLGYADALANDKALSPDRREQAAVIRGKGEELKQLIENLNLTNRLEHSMEPLQAQWFSPAAALRESASTFLNQLSDPAFTIAVEISPTATELMMYGDRGLILRMLNNLIGNSLRHNANGCTVTATLELKGRRLVMGVSDDGTGYPPSLLKTPKNKSATGSAHGLGMTIAAQIAAAHRGSISFSNGKDGGAVCRVSFPGPFKKRKSAEAD